MSRRAFLGKMNPTVVPRMRVAVDWHHPLARGLIYLLVPGSPHGLRNLAGTGRDLPYPVSGTSIAMRAGGPAFREAGLTGAEYVVTNGAPFQPQQGTIIWRGRKEGSFSTYATIFGITHNSLNQNPWNACVISDNGSANRPAFWSNSSGSLYSVSWPADYDASGKTHLAAAFTAGSQVVLYTNGARVLSSSISANIVYAASSSIVYQGEPTGTQNANMSSTFAALYNVPLTDDLIAWQEAEPFAMLRPAPALRRYYVVTALPPLALAESVAISDGWSVGMTVARGLSDAIAASDTMTARGSFAASLAESAGVSDALATSLVIRAISLSDAVTVSDAMAPRPILTHILSETLAAADRVTSTAGLAVSLSETIGARDVFEIVGQHVRASGFGVSSGSRRRGIEAARRIRGAVAALRSGN